MIRTSDRRPPRSPYHWLRRLLPGRLRRFVAASLLGSAAAIAALSATEATAAQFAAATHEGRARLPSCGEGGFADLAGQCWQCPEGFKHDNFLLPPQHERVCRADTQFSTGIRHAPAALGCPAGQWPSLHNGHCYTCPAGYGHDLARNGDDPRVCFKRQEPRVDYARGIRHGRTVLGLGCPAGQWPSLHNGHCYTCPAGYGHDLARNGDDARVCFRRSGGETLHSAGTRHAKVNIGVCPAGQWVSLHDSACYTCPPGYGQDIARSGNDPRVCHRRQERFSRAARGGNLLCERGFFDPVRRGSCWSCPAHAGIRTLAPVDGDRACTDELTAIVAVDVCRPLIGALREGQKGLQSVQGIVQTLVGPVLTPLNRVVEQVTGKLQSPRELDDLLERLGQPLRPHARHLDEMQRLQGQLDRSAGALRDALFDPDLLCGGDLRALDRRLAALGVQPKLAQGKSRWLAQMAGQLPIGAAHAAERSAFTAFSATLDLGQIGSPVNAIVLTAVTNFQGRGGVFLSLGRSLSADPAGGIAVGLMVFPSTSIDAFDEMQNLGTAMSLDRERVGRLFRRPHTTAATANPAATAATATPAGNLPVPAPGAAPQAGSRLPDSIDVSFDPLFRPESGPGFGVSKSLVGFGGKGSGAAPARLPLEASFDWSFRLR